MPADIRRTLSTTAVDAPRMAAAHPAPPPDAHAAAYLVIDAVGREAGRCRVSGPRAAAVRRLLRIDWDPDDAGTRPLQGLGSQAP